MSNFLSDDFLLLNKPARELYHSYSKNMPIIDYHCHLNPKEIYENKLFNNLTDIWLKGDHYKWRGMRTLGIKEELITGDASDYDKYKAWAKCVPMTIGNPLYHWTHLELKTPFGIDNMVLNENTADKIWNIANEKLATDSFKPRGIIKQMNVETICTTDDPADSLEYHIKLIEEKDCSFRVYPTFRPDKAVAVDFPIEYKAYINKLAATAKMEINSYLDLLDALKKRHDFFHSVGCRLSDHAMALPVYKQSNEKELTEIFSTLMAGNRVSSGQKEQFQTAMFQYFGRLNSEKNWTMQLHIGVQRNNNTRMFNKIGVDAGFDSITDGPIAIPLAKLLDSLDVTNELPKTILYTLNPTYNDIIATMIGNFQDGSIAGKVQFGSGWWFNDQKSGMEKQMDDLANMGMLSQFVGMLTDSRSFLSYTRHEYFRRILCNMVGTWVENGEAPEDYDLLGKMVQDISYNNSKNYFNFPK